MATPNATRSDRQLELAPFQVDQTKPSRRKTCGMCGVCKDITAFSKYSASPDGAQFRCKLCVSINDKSRERGAPTPEQLARKAQRSANKEQRAQRAAYAKSKAGRLSKFRCDLRRKYALTIDGWLEMWAAQQGCCARCSEPMVKPPQFDGKKGRAAKMTASVDHCHHTGLVRSLLCGPCNRRIGHLEQLDERHIADLAYIARFKTSAVS